MNKRQEGKEEIEGWVTDIWQVEAIIRSDPDSLTPTAPTTIKGLNVYPTKEDFEGWHPGANCVKVKITIETINKEVF